ncbi:MAG: hypothetical protein Q9209_000440 [Squamulea sp. 1 TL-2023]
MNANSFSVGSFPPPPGLPALQNLVRPDQIPKLANIPEERKPTYIQGVTALWETIKSKPSDSQEYQIAYKKLHEVSESLKKAMNQASQVRAAGQNGSRPNSQGQPQPDARPTGQQPGQVQPSQFSQKVMDNVRNQNFVVPQDILVQGKQRVQTWLQESKQRYAVWLQKYETSQLKLQELKVITQNKEGKTITAQEAQQLNNFKNTHEQNHQQASTWLKKFLNQQQALRSQAGNANSSIVDATARGVTPAAPATEQSTGLVEPQASQTSTAVNTVSDHQGQPHTVSSALDAARNHPSSAGRPGSSAGTGGQSNQGSINQSTTTQTTDGQAAAEHSQAHQNTNAASVAPPQYHSSQAPNLTTNMHQGPHPLSHQAAVSQSAEKYSQHTYQNPAGPASTHAHPPMSSGRDPQNSNQKMPIPKELKHPPPQPVVMGPARPTLTGGPSNGAMGSMGQPAIQKQPSYVLDGEGERVLGRKKLEDLTLLDVADDFVDQVVSAACKLAKLRSSQTLELRDIQLVLERNYNIRIPGYASDELRTVKKYLTAISTNNYSYKVDDTMSLGNGISEPSEPADAEETKHVKLPSNLADEKRRPERVEEHFYPHSRSRYPFATKSWQQRPQSPGLEWHKQYDTRKTGRVLVIDYIKKERSKEGMRKVATQEIDSIEGLRKIYTNPDRGGDAVLRVFHVQNATWATHFLLRKFNISASDDLVGTDFGYYVKNKHRERRGKPLLTGKSWKTTHDPWRAINRTSFGLDYLKPYRVSNPQRQDRRDTTGKMMELSCYDEDDNPAYGWDVYAQRLSCYIQHKEPPSEIPGYPAIENPYENGSKKKDPHEYFPRLESLDNGNAIIIFENSCSGSIDDTMVEARSQWESKWRRLPFYLAYESQNVSNDDTMALECMKIILADIWKSISESWDRLIDLSNVHVDCLQDRIYEQPADESRAPELWTNASNWLKVERLVTIHTNVVKEMQDNLRELASEPTAEDNWLEKSPGDMERIGTLVQEDLVKPTDSLNDLMYKSVEIRDSRHSLQLNTSMWRLSWITFIFLPLTFIVGFFGMNVDIFGNDPSIKWYFVSAVPLMTVVLSLWYIIKHVLARRRQTPYQRGIYEHLFHDLASDYPTLWSRAGPRKFIRPQGMMGRLKWALILYWNRPEKTVRSGAPDPDSDADDLGAWARCKRTLTRRWTSQLRGTAPVGISSSALEEGNADDFGMISDGISGITELLALPVTEHAEDLPGGMLRLPLSPGSEVRRQKASPRGSSLERPSRPTSKGSTAGRDSGVLVEEEALNWLQELGRRSYEFTERIGGIGIQQDNRSRSRGSESRRESSVAVPSHDDSRRQRLEDRDG